MVRPKDPRSDRSRPPLPLNIYPLYNRGNLNCSRSIGYQNWNNCPNYNTNFHTEFIYPNEEIYSQSTHSRLDFHSESYEKESVSSEPLDPKLDFCSDSFDPNFFLNQPHGVVKNLLPYPKAKEYNNLAEYYSHVFLKKDNFKKVEKDRMYDRNYDWYYKILGWDHRIQKRYEERILRKTRKYAGWLTAKLRKYKPSFLNDDPNYEPCRSFPPLQSSKIIQTQSKFRKYKIFPKNIVSDSKESAGENLVSDMPELNMAKENILMSKTGNNSSVVTTSTETVSSSKTPLVSETKNNQK